MYRGTLPGGETFLVKLGNVAAYLDSGLTNGITYYYKVAASNSLGQGQNSTEAYAMPATIPTEPLNLQAIPGNAEVVLTWSAPATDGGSPVTNYVVYRGASSGGETRLTEIGNVLTYTDVGLVNGQTYYYQVTAKNVAGEGPPSNEASATPATVPGAPTSLSAVAGNGQLTLNWIAPADDGGFPITNYAVYRGVTSGGETLLIEVADVLTHTDTGLVNGQKYYYEVSAQSNEANATPFAPPNQPPTCAIATPSAGDMISGIYTVSGSASDPDGAVEYVEVRIDGGIWIMTTGNSSWSHALDTLGLPDGAHTIYARSYDGANYSDTVNVTVNVNNAAPPHPGEPSVLEQAWFWIVVVAVVIMAVLLLLILLRRRRQMQRVREETSEASAEKTGEEQKK